MPPSTLSFCSGFGGFFFFCKPEHLCDLCGPTFLITTRTNLHHGKGSVERKGHVTRRINLNSLNRQVLELSVCPLQAMLPCP